MATATQILKKYQQVNVNEAVEVALMDSRGDLIRAQRLQMQQGLDKMGKPFINKNTGTDEYAPSTAKKKGKKKPIDLKDKGDFQNEIFVDIRENTFVIDSADSKSEKLIKQFGEGIFGLNSESRITTKPGITKNLLKQVKVQMHELQPA